MSADDQSTGQTAQFPTVKRTIIVLERKEIEYEELPSDQKEPLLDFMMKLRTAESLGPLAPVLHPALVEGGVEHQHHRPPPAQRHRLVARVVEQLALDEAHVDDEGHRGPDAGSQRTRPT